MLTYLAMTSKDKCLRQLEQAATSRVQGSLSESTRQCGDPTCACAQDPASHHGPHLYFRYECEGKVHSVYTRRPWAKWFGMCRTRRAVSAHRCGDFRGES